MEETILVMLQIFKELVIIIGIIVALKGSKCKG